MDLTQIEQQLKIPFPASDVEFRISRVSKNNRKAHVLAYITSRAVMDRLDAVFGLDGWQDDYDVLSGGVVCRLRVKINDAWLEKVDSAPFTNIEPLKGGFSDALKRAAVKIGIGRYLYNLPEYEVDLLERKPSNVAPERVHFYYSKDLVGSWIEPVLPAWALPQSTAKQTKTTILQPVTTENKAETNTVQLWARKEIHGSDDLRIELLNLLSHLSGHSALTAAKEADYKRKFNDESVSFELLSYFYDQLLLIDKLYFLFRENRVTNDERKEYYKSILSSKRVGLRNIEATLDSQFDLAA